MSWEPLKKGDAIDLVAPSYGVSKEALQKAKEYIESLGLIPIIPKKMMGDDLFCSNDDASRFLQLKHALENPKSKAIWCLKGGYGAARLIPMLDKVKQPKREKLLIGFSDITSLHIYFRQRWGWKSLHAPVLWQVIENKVKKKSVDELIACMFGKRKQVEFSKLEPLNKAAKNVGSITSTVIGGNLSLVQTSIGTPWQIDADGAMVVLEDTDEKSYSYDRMLLHVQQSGVLREAKAILLGEFCHHDDEAERVPAMLSRFARAWDIPVFRIKHVGHGLTNHPMPLGTKAVLTGGKTIKLSVDVR